MPIDLYYLPGSAPCRAVLLTAKALGLELNLKLTNLLKGEHLTPEFLKLNPQHTIPTLDDNGFVLAESRAIITYLVDQYGKNDTLYPKDAKKRALINQRLYFDVGLLYSRIADYFYPVFFHGESYDADKLEKLKEALGFLDLFLTTGDFIAGNELTIADLSIVASITTVESVDFDLSAYKNIVQWLERVKKVAPGYEEINAKGVQELKQLVAQLIKK